MTSAATGDIVVLDVRVSLCIESLISEQRESYWLRIPKRSSRSTSEAKETAATTRTDVVALSAKAEQEQEERFANRAWKLEAGFIQGYEDLRKLRNQWLLQKRSLEEQHNRDIVAGYLRHEIEYRRQEDQLAAACRDGIMVTAYDSGVSDYPSNIGTAFSGSSISVIRYPFNSHQYHRILSERRSISTDVSRSLSAIAKVRSFRVLRYLGNFKRKFSAIRAIAIVRLSSEAIQSSSVLARHTLPSFSTLLNTPLFRTSILIVSVIQVRHVSMTTGHKGNLRHISCKEARTLMY